MKHRENKTKLKQNSQSTTTQFINNWNHSVEQQNKENNKVSYFKVNCDTLVSNWFIKKKESV